jgi:hypothetical protein
MNDIIVEALHRCYPYAEQMDLFGDKAGKRRKKRDN